LLGYVVWICFYVAEYLGHELATLFSPRSRNRSRIRKGEDIYRSPIASQFIFKLGKILVNQNTQKTYCDNRRFFVRKDP
jgi:hypothetical protein